MKFFVLSLIMSIHCLAALNNTSCHDSSLAELLKIDTQTKDFFNAPEWNKEPTKELIPFFKNFLSKGNFETNLATLYRVSDEKTIQHKINGLRYTYKNLINLSFYECEIHKAQALLARLEKEREKLSKVIDQESGPSSHS